LYAGLRSVEASAAVIATLLEPVTATVAAALFLDEDIGVRGLVGTLAILGAVLALAHKDPHWERRREAVAQV
jgi:DME family drug/metabolite transporter